MSKVNPGRLLIGTPDLTRSVSRQPAHHALGRWRIPASFTNLISLRKLTAAFLLLASGFALCAGTAAAKPALRRHVPLIRGEMRGKDHRHRGITARTASAFSVSLSASATTLWPTQTATLTATANQNVGPTPYFIRIYDISTQSFVASCGTGTTCSAQITEPTEALNEYVAYVAAGGSAVQNVQAASALTEVNWLTTTESLSASPTTVAIGGTATVTATTGANIGPSPFYTEIFDATTGTRVAVCGVGTTCSATVSQNVATTHKYIAYLSADSTTSPPSAVQSTSAADYVTWANGGWQVSLSAPASSYGSETVTATANMNVGPTPYYISIFDETTGAFVGHCATGSSCSVAFTPHVGGDDLVAFVGSDSALLPPQTTVASSSVAFTNLEVVG